MFPIRDSVEEFFDSLKMRKELPDNSLYDKSVGYLTNFVDIVARWPPEIKTK